MSIRAGEGSSEFDSASQMVVGVIEMMVAAVDSTWSYKTQGLLISIYSPVLEALLGSSLEYCSQSLAASLLSRVGAEVKEVPNFRIILDPSMIKKQRGK